MAEPGDGGPRLRAGALRLADWLALPAPPDCGALAFFAGTVRDHHEGRSVLGIHYHVHASLAEKRLKEIERSASERFGATVRLAHGSGELAVGEASVVVVAYAAHRAQAFEACRWAIDAIKLAVPIWKEERYVEGESRFLEGQVIRPVSAL